VLVLVLLALLVIVLVVTKALERATLRRLREDLAHGRWEPGAPGPDHARVAPIVADLEAEGYVVDSYAVLARRPHPSSTVALVHPDGSLALVSVDRAPVGIRYTHLVIRSVLVPGEHSLVTAAFASVPAVRDALVEVAVRRPGVAATVARHRTSRRWIEDQGVAVTPVRPGGAGAAVEAMLRASARVPVAPLQVVQWRGLIGGGRFRLPLAERPELAPVVWDIRRRQREGAGVQGPPPGV
jgi:hypothetical protein